ncbi:hypothetical protein PINS_up024526 [Pythium insidiosum]|nr:hypothetical protein PINS_up024526 [Pythium insidiosum]
MFHVSKRMTFWGNVLCTPLCLIINFSLFQYLVATYFHRRSESRPVLLMLTAFIGFAALIPAEYPDEGVVRNLEDISESASTLTFLVQIVIIGRDVTRKVKIRSLRLMTLGAEFLVAHPVRFASCWRCSRSFTRALIGRGYQESNRIINDIALWFIFGFRFFYIGMAKGWRHTVQTRRGEMVLYLFYVTHDYPFYALEASTRMSWEPVRALWSRLTLMFCILFTIRSKILSSKSSKRTVQKTRTHGGGPSLPDNVFSNVSSNSPSIKPSRAPDSVNGATRKPGFFGGRSLSSVVPQLSTKNVNRP